MTGGFQTKSQHQVLWLKANYGVPVEKHNYSLVLTEYTSAFQQKSQQQALWLNEKKNRSTRAKMQILAFQLKNNYSLVLTGYTSAFQPEVNNRHSGWKAYFSIPAEKQLQSGSHWGTHQHSNKKLTTGILAEKHILAFQLKKQNILALTGHTSEFQLSQQQALWLNEKRTQALWLKRKFYHSSRKANCSLSLPRCTSALQL